MMTKAQAILNIRRHAEINRTRREDDLLDTDFLDEGPTEPYVTVAVSEPFSPEDRDWFRRPIMCDAESRTPGIRS